MKEHLPLVSPCIPVSDIQWPEMRKEISIACIDRAKSIYSKFTSLDFDRFVKFEGYQLPNPNLIEEEKKKYGAYLEKGKLNCYTYSSYENKTEVEEIAQKQAQATSSITLESGNCVEVTSIHRGSRGYF